MRAPFYIVQSWYEPKGHPFFHETDWTQTDMAKLGEDIAEGQFGSHRLDAVRRYDPAAERMSDVTSDALHAAIDYAERVETHLPNNVVDACERLSIDVPRDVLPIERRTGWRIEPRDASTLLNPNEDSAFRALGRRAA